MLEEDLEKKWSWMNWKSRNYNGRIPGSTQSSKAMFWPPPGLKVRTFHSFGYSARILISGFMLQELVRKITSMSFHVISQNKHQCTPHLYAQDGHHTQVFMWLARMNINAVCIFRPGKDIIHEFPCEQPEPSSMHSVPSGSRETPSTSTSSPVMRQNHHQCTLYL